MSCRFVSVIRIFRFLFHFWVCFSDVFREFRRMRHITHSYIDSSHFKVSYESRTSDARIRRIREAKRETKKNETVLLINCLFDSVVVVLIFNFFLHFLWVWSFELARARTHGIRFIYFLRNVCKYERFSALRSHIVRLKIIRYLHLESTWKYPSASAVMWIFLFASNFVLGRNYTEGRERECVCHAVCTQILFSFHHSSIEVLFLFDLLFIIPRQLCRTEKYRFLFYPELSERRETGIFGDNVKKLCGKI